MKKTILFAASLLALAACTKEVSTTEEAAVKAEGITLSISGPVTTVDTKAVYDGDSHITWQTGDRLKVALGASADAEKNIESGYNNLYGQTAFADATVNSTDDATFSVKYSMIPEAALNGDVYLFGMYPSSAFKPSSTSTSLTGVTVELPAAQAPTATSWDPKADIMVAKPSLLSLVKSDYDESYKEYTVTASAAPMTFAHVFGFGKITFAGLPEDMMNSVVKSVMIEDVNGAKTLAGRYKIDLNKSIVTNPAQPGDQYYASSAITLTPASETMLKDFNAMFVCNPGTYDVKITVSTLAGTYVATRSGLKITRAGLAAPTLNYKADTDQLEGAPVVDITDMEWSQEMNDFYKLISSSTNSYTAAGRPFWGPEEKKMYFTVKYPGSTKELYPSYEGSKPYVQKFNNAFVDGGEIDLISDNAFRGVKQVKIVTGILHNDVDGVVSAYLVNGSESTLLGSAEIKGNATAYNGNNGVTCVFDAPAGKGEGVLKLVWNHFNNGGDEQVVADAKPYFKVYIASLCINAAPAVTLEKEAVTVPAAGESAQIGCAVAGAEADPEITCSESWLTATWADGKLSYTVDANTGDKRTATITITASGLGSTVKTVAVTQKSANEKEYTIKITPASVADALEAAHTADPSASNYTFDVAFNGVAEDGSVDTESVTIRFGMVYYVKDVIEMAMQSSSYTVQYSVSNITALPGYVTYMGCVANDRYGSSGNCIRTMTAATGGNGYDPSKYTWQKTPAPYPAAVDGYYTNSISLSDESAVYFLFQTYGKKTTFKSLEVRYIK